jgi:Protein of unknown function (DUF3429)
MNRPEALASTPSPAARWLGYAGLVPFVLGMAAVWHAPAWQLQAQQALQAYAALIASFLGGIHWGIAATQSKAQHTGHLLWGVTPSLLAWVALMLPNAWPLVTLAGVLALCFAVDMRLYARAGLQAWLGLRLQLTLVAVLSCAGAAFRLLG